MLIRRCAPIPNELQWLAEPGSAPLRDLWVGRLYLTETWQGVPHASAETALLFMVGRANVSVTSPHRVSHWYNYDAGVSERAIYDWPRGDLIIIPPTWGIHVVPLADVVDVLVFQAWLPEGKRSGLPAMVMGRDTTITRHSSTCLSRDYGSAARQLHIGTTENADGYGSYPLHDDGWRGEEIRIYDIAGGSDAIQRLRGQYVTGAETDTAAVVRSGDVCVLPYGDTQPVLRGPNVAVAYTWAWVEVDASGSSSGSTADPLADSPTDDSPIYADYTNVLTWPWRESDRKRVKWIHESDPPAVPDECPYCAQNTLLRADYALKLGRTDLRCHICGGYAKVLVSEDAQGRVLGAVWAKEEHTHGLDG